MSKYIQKSCSTLNESLCGLRPLFVFQEFMLIFNLQSSKCPSLLSQNFWKFENQLGNIFLIKLQGGKSNSFCTTLDNQQKPRSMGLV